MYVIKMLLTINGRIHWVQNAEMLDCLDKNALGCS